MSKHDIQNVATLAAHLAIQDSKGRVPLKYSAVIYASDAMQLQRLGRRARNNATRLCNIPDYQPKFDAEIARIRSQVAEVLQPYGLRAQVGGDPRGYCLHVMGLPGNTLGGYDAGLGI